ncbi:MAG: 4Fe-4S dicluster domain-containing protein [Deltaproteobacteria bacterium]|nr:4Fe-4S dicluster domain-containing protein [Deltaproteobacteria bacterium]MBW2132269.1 4Fe-4S dicluster domain-containing protein [Deltaproteobacteria bacterium]
MQLLRIKKGYTLRAAGVPSLNLERRKTPDTVAVVPHYIPFIKPRLAVQEKDAVKTGTLLFADKHWPELKFRSPGTGIVEAIRLGPRRILEAVVIRLDEKETHESFEPVSDAALETMGKADLKSRIQDGGLWALFRELPFRNIPMGANDPPGIIVTLGTREPFEPHPSVYLNDASALFRFGLRVLQKLSGHVAVVLPSKYAVPSTLKEAVTHEVSGHYPCGDAGVFLYRTKTDPKHNRTWTLHGQDLLLLSRFLREGRYPTQKIVVTAGPKAQNPCHVTVRLGAPLRHIARTSGSDGAHRFVVGGVFTGYPASGEDYLGFHENAVVVLSEDPTPEKWAFFKPGYQKPTYSRAFWSRLTTRLLPVDTRYHGEERACIGCGYCAEVCPVDILPQFTYKAAVIGEMEEALAHGILDCVECGLCSYVCPSKIDLVHALKRVRADLYREEVHR